MVTTVAAVLTAAALGLTGGSLPDGFLLMEKQAEGPHPKWEHWTVSDSRKKALMLDPCDTAYHTGKPAKDKGRHASRTILFTSEYRFKSEQVVLYRDERAARTVMKTLRADLKRCAKRGKGFSRSRYYSKPLKLGDEAVKVGARDFENGLRAVAVRRGAALILYTESAWPSTKLPAKEFRALTAKAATMTAKICRLPEARC